jgi:hypothetical protein
VDWNDKVSETERTVRMEEYGQIEFFGFALSIDDRIVRRIVMDWNSALRWLRSRFLSLHSPLLVQDEALVF